MFVLIDYFKSWKSLEVHTVDKFQGRDKDLVIISLVRSNPQHQVGTLLEDWRRINVAFTRAKRKMIIIGSRKTLSACPTFAEVLGLCESKKWVLSFFVAVLNFFMCSVDISAAY